jgi:hypothetical protein
MIKPRFTATARTINPMITYPAIFLYPSVDSSIGRSVIGKAARPHIKIQPSLKNSRNIVCLSFIGEAT